MLTIRHIETTGHESVFETARVSYCPRQLEMTRECVFWERPDGSAVEINSGTVYVMNSGGKTVSIYRLGFEPIESV